MTDPFPTYDVLAKRDTPSWNEQTREVVDRRLALAVAEGVLSDTQLATLRAITTRVCPDSPERPATTTLAMVVRKIGKDEGDGHRLDCLPRTAECWCRGLDAIEAEARLRFDRDFAELEPDNANKVLGMVEHGEVCAELWEDLPSELFWKWRLLPDLASAHWAQPSLWSAMGFGGPASPRGYVRLGENRRDPWEAVEESRRPLRGWPQHHER